MDGLEPHVSYLFGRLKLYTLERFFQHLFLLGTNLGFFSPCVQLPIFIKLVKMEKSCENCSQIKLMLTHTLKTLVDSEL